METNFGTFYDGMGDRSVPRHLTGNYERDVRTGAFRVDESDPEFEVMYQDVLDMKLTDARTGQRLDAGETGGIARQLLYVKARTYDVKYPMFKARLFIPVSHEVPSGAETWAYWQYDAVGMAKIIANYANDFPRSDVKAFEYTQRIVPLGASFAYTVQDLRRIAFMNRGGEGIDVKRAGRAHMSIEKAIDDLASVGSAIAGFTGFINNPNVPVLAAPTGNWGVVSALQMVSDLNAMWQGVMNQTNQVEIPNALILAPVAYNIATSTPFSALGNMTVAQWFIANNPHIDDLDQWVNLALANASGTGSRQVCYRRDPDAVFMEIPQEFEQFAPQLLGMEYSVPCHARFGGVAWPYPLSALYMDGVD